MNSLVPGYAYGQCTLTRAPYTVAEFAALKRTLLFTEGDVGASPQDVEQMHAARVKSVLMHAIPWSQSFVKEGEF
jgi:hypothetical protein